MRLKDCTRTEFQACARYLLGISSRHISVVTRRFPASGQPLQPSSTHHPRAPRGRLTRDDILFAKSLACRLPLLLILCAQEFLSAARGATRCAQISCHSRRKYFFVFPLFSVSPFLTLSSLSSSPPPPPLRRLLSFAKGFSTLHFVSYYSLASSLPLSSLYPRMDDDF